MEEPSEGTMNIQKAVNNSKIPKGLIVNNCNKMKFIRIFEYFTVYIGSLTRKSLLKNINKIVLL